MKAGWQGIVRLSSCKKSCLEAQQRPFAPILDSAMNCIRKFWFFTLAVLCLGVAEARGTTVTGVAAGNDGYHSLFLASDGSVWGTGYNAYGQLGDGGTNDVFSPEEIVSSDVTAMAAGGYGSLFIKSDGSLWGMGNDRFGHLGNGSTTNQLTPIQILSGGRDGDRGGTFSATSGGSSPGDSPLCQRASARPWGI